MGHNRHGGHSDPFVGEQFLPAHEAQATTWTGGPCQVGECGLWVVEEHHAEAAHDNVEWLVERGRLGVAPDEIDVHSLLLCPPASQRQHGRREVEACHAPTGYYGSGRLQAHGTVSAPDVKDPLARLEHGCRQQPTTEGGEHGVEALGLRHPDIGRAPVPVVVHVSVRHKPPFLTPGVSVVRRMERLWAQGTEPYVPTSAGCWVLGAGCWVLGAGCWVLGAPVRRLGPPPRQPPGLPHPSRGDEHGLEVHDERAAVIIDDRTNAFEETVSDCRFESGVIAP